MASLIIGIITGVKNAMDSHQAKKKASGKESKQPSAERQSTSQGETLREKATKKLHGEGANPSQLGDPISIKAETSDTSPTEDEEGSVKKNSGDKPNQMNVKSEKTPTESDEEVWRKDSKL